MGYIGGILLVFCVGNIAVQELEKREAELGAVQKELGEATQHISDLAAELVQVRGRGDPGMVKSAMKQVSGSGSSLGDTVRHVDDL